MLQVIVTCNKKFVRPLRFWLALPPARAGGSHPIPIRYHVTLGSMGQCPDNR